LENNGAHGFSRGSDWQNSHFEGKTEDNMQERAMFDEEKPRPKGEIIVGEDLYDFAVEELEERIAALREEISRVEQARKEKRKGLDAAAAIFGKS
jgi:uncharacterized small protein (DUF1192 family)